VSVEKDVPTIINGAGPVTRLSGGPLAPGVIQAMAKADHASVDMADLQAFASRKIAAATGSEAGMVTGGAAAGILLSAAAAMARLDVRRINSLPETDGPHEIVVARSHRNGYDHALRAAGARLVEVGFPEPLAGSGVRDVEVWEYDAAIGPATAAILFVASPLASPALGALSKIAKARNIPLIVDAAAELPPAANLRRFIAEGADLVSFSGGKILGGPAGSGLLSGRRDLVMSAALQSLDMDVPCEEWSPPADFIEKAKFVGLPRQGIGRACKVGKHEVFGLLAALDHFLAEGDATRHARWLATCRRIEAAIKASADFSVVLIGGSSVEHVPQLELRFDDPARSRELRQRLLARATPVHLGRDRLRPERLRVNPTCLRETEIAPLIDALVG
jgi:L-seryl-tRNA(Ser) seleniumtransferase